MKLSTHERRGLIALLILSLFLSSIPSFTSQTAEFHAAEGVRTIAGYRDYRNITDELMQLRDSNPSLVHLESLGMTWEGRNIWAVKISDNVMSNEDEPEVLVMGGHHGNELPAVEIPMRFIEFLADNYGKNLTVTRLVDTREIWIVPMVNPDGYEYSLEGHDWRKNRRPVDTDGDGVIDGTGVDINRNYGYRWGEEADAGATSHDPTSRIYCGPAPFSENETRAVRELVERHNFTVSMSFHTYGQVIYYPWGNADDENGAGQATLSAMAAEMGRLSGYTPMEGRDAYATTGDSDDWLFANRSCYPFTIELGSEYIAPPEQLPQMFQRILPAMTYAIEMAGKPERAELSDWTVMAYMSGDNTLSDQVGVDMDEMKAGLTSATDRMNLIALADTGGAGDTHLYRLEYIDNSSEMAVINGSGIIPADGEADMSLPSTLSDFINWSVVNYPAQRYLLVLWGHGGDLFTGVGPDKGRWLDALEIREALKWSGVHMSIVGFDACYMGSVEIYNSLIPYTDTIVSSQVEEREEGWDYTALVQKISTEPEIGTEMLAGFLVDSYADYYSSRGDVAMAALDTHMLNRSFMPAFEAWAALMERQLYPEYAVISRIRNASVSYYGDMLDLRTMLLLTNMTSDASEELRGAAIYLLEQSERPFIREFHSQLYNINGMGLYFPADASDTRYPLLFESRWADVVGEYSHPIPYPIFQHDPTTDASLSFPCQIKVRLSESGFDQGWSPVINSSTSIALLYSATAPFSSSWAADWKAEEMTGSNTYGLYTATIPSNSSAFVPEIWYYVKMTSAGKQFVFPWNAGISVRAEDIDDGRFYEASLEYTTDIRISSISVPDIAVVNVPLSVNITVENSGTIGASCVLSFETAYRNTIDNSTIAGDSGSKQFNISAGDSKIVHLHTTPLHSGNMSFSAFVRMVNLLDSDTSNNNLSIQIYVEADMDGDGIGDMQDTDRDGDGYSNSLELAEGSDPNSSLSIPADNDGDGIPDDIDLDDDNDGFPDSRDAYPMDPGAHYNPVPMLSLALVLVILLVVMSILRHRRLI